MYKDTNLPNITIDHRESKSAYLNFLAKHQAFPFVLRPLRVGDIVIDNLVIERKVLPDFYLSLNEGRLFRQLRELKRFRPRQLLLLEGATTSAFLNKPGLRGLYLRITAGWQIPILYTRNPEDTAACIVAIARQGAFASSGPVSPRPRSKHFRDLSVSEKMLMQIPTIGYRRAEALITHFKTIEGIFGASEADLIKVPGIGAKRAKVILAI